MDTLTVDSAKQRIPELEGICSARANSVLLADLGACYFTIGEPEKALPLLQLAWDKNKNASIGMNLGLILKDLGRHSESFHVIEQAYWLEPENFYIRLGYGEALLRAGFWAQAWTIYDNARPTQAGAAMDLRLPQAVKEWNGGPLPEGHRLFVINEGGVGDRLSYARWLPELTKRGINWKFYPYSQLFSFFTRVFPRDLLSADGDEINPTHWCTTFSLPAKLNITPSQIPPPLPLTAMQANIDRYRLNVSDGYPVVGLCYAAAELFQGDRKVRSLSEGQAMRLVTQTMGKVHWVSLQYGKTMPYPVQTLPLGTWEETAGLIHNLDAVVTCDTGVMHLAGAMGKKMSVLLSGNSCWKFLAHGKKLPLYPSAKFYRNDKHGFEHALDELILDISNGTAWS